jgi:hypothetical protein
MDVFEAASGARMESTIRDFLRQAFPEKVYSYSDFELARFCSETLGRCSRYGLYQAHDVAWFAAVRLSIHPAFDEHPNIRQALEAPRDEGEEAVPAILDMTTPLDWHEAKHLPAPAL